MPAQSTVNTSSLIRIKLAGEAISQTMMDDLEEVLIDQHAHLPAMFRLRFHESGFALIDKGPFDLTKEVEIVGLDDEQKSHTLIKGEITAIEPEFAEGMLTFLVVHGYDKSHRLFRETKSRAFMNKKDSDLAREIGQSVGLNAQVEATNTVYDHIYQHNQSDMAFLKQRAWRIGYECYVDEGKLFFQKPKQSASGVKLTWGEDLITFMPRMTLAEQVDEVVVRGWDVDKQEAIVGRAANGRLYPKNGESKDGAAWAGVFGTGKRIIVDQPVVSQAEADKLAEARLDELSGAFIEAEGAAFRRPDIQAGKIVELDNVGQRFSGKYLVTSATHRFTQEGFKTTFQVRGTRTGLLSDQLANSTPTVKWPGVVTAVVTNTEDDTQWGSVKVKFPWMSDDAESAWARVMGLGAGNNAGLCLIPEVGDEVLVAFELGDFNRPFVIGGVWNGKMAIPEETAEAQKGKRPMIRSWRSRKGHVIAMHDESEEKINVITAGGHRLTLDDKGKSITIESSGGHQIILDDQGKSITVKSGGKMTLEASQTLKIKAGATLDIEGQIVNIKGQTVKLN
jgi:phage protein D/phage baseplate assembly protein gpV